MDESGLFFWALPTKSMNFKSDQYEGGQMFKDRITLVLCCNAEREKQSPTVINESSWTQCCKNDVMTQQGVSWYVFTKACMRSTVFQG
jgi:hypothetical protein